MTLAYACKIDDHCSCYMTAGEYPCKRLRWLSISYGQIEVPVTSLQLCRWYLAVALGVTRPGGMAHTATIVSADDNRDMAVTHSALITFTFPHCRPQVLFLDYRLQYYKSGNMEYFITEQKNINKMVACCCGALQSGEKIRDHWLPLSCQTADRAYIISLGLYRVGASVSVLKCIRGGVPMRPTDGPSEFNAEVIILHHQVTRSC